MTMPTHLLLWVLFNVFIFSLLILDLTVFHKKAHTVKMKEALLWSAFWVSLALIFNLGVGLVAGQDKALQFFTGYVLEESLSIDNLFVFIQLFNYFRVPTHFQHRVLFWGILGVIITRASFILGGIALMGTFHWIIYVFGAFLVFTGIKIGLGHEGELRPEKNPVIRFLRKFFRVSETFEDGKFFIKKNGVTYITSLLIVLVTIEMTDIVFAIDSIPAVLAVTNDSFIAYSSNLFAVLGLRALYFALSGMMGLFHYLKYALAAILIFIGFKMLLSGLVHFSTLVSLGFIVVVLALAIGASLMHKKAT